MAQGEGGRGPRTIYWMAAVLLAVLLALVLRSSLGDAVSAAAGWGIALGVPALLVLLLRNRIRWRSTPARTRDERQVDHQRRQWASQDGWEYHPEPRDVDVGLSRSVLLGNSVADNSRQQVRGTHDGRSFTYQTWQVTRAKRPTKSRTNPMLMSTETHEVLVVQTQMALPAVWLWGRDYFSFQRWPAEFPLKGHGRYPLQVRSWPDAKGAALPEQWPVLEPVLAPFLQALRQTPVLLGAGGHRVSLAWQRDPTVATAQQRLQLVSAVAANLEAAARAGQIPHGDPDPVGP